ncbi:MAG: glycosyl hydrolase family 95 catalytic domain-containing protein [Methanosarcinaceae archaeon]
MTGKTMKLKSIQRKIAEWSVISSLVIVPCSETVISQNNSTLSVRQTITDRQIPVSNLWYEGVPLGNGDLGMIVYGSGDRLTFAVGKNDLWDRRYYNDPATQKKYRPTPKPACKIQIWQPSDETESNKKSLQPMQHSLSLENAELITAVANISITSRVQKDRNMIFLEFNDVKGKTIISLNRGVDTTRSEKYSSEHQVINNIGLVIQDLPPERTYPKGFRSVVTAKLLNDVVEPELTNNEITWTIEKDCILAVAVVTTRDNPKPVSEAKRIIFDVADYQKLRDNHIAQWQSFWEKSWITIDDREIQDLWYSYLYLLNSATKPGAIAPGLFSPWIVNNKSAWNGSYTIDYNFQQNYDAALSSNHADLMEAYFATVERALPNAREIANILHGKKGIIFPHEMFPIDAKGKIIEDKFYYRIETPYLLQHFWEYYEYTQDDNFLRERCYPIISECAESMINLFISDDGNGKYSMPNYKSLEHPKSPLAKNGTPELGFVQYILKAAIRGAEILSQDSDKVARWQEILKGLPAYSTTRNQLGKIFLDCEIDDDAWNAAPPIELKFNGWRPSKLEGNTGAWMYYNLANSLLQVWPCEQIDMDSPADELLTAIRTWMTIKLEGSNNIVSHYVIASRLGIDSYNDFKRELSSRALPNGLVTTKVSKLSSEFDYDWGYFRFWTYGIFLENCGIPLVINEMMLQSHNNTIKLFPTLNVHRRAEFHHLRARGGFLVSAKVDRGFVELAEIEATVDRECRVRLPWPYSILSIENISSGTPVSVREDGNDIVFDARAGNIYRITPKPDKPETKRKTSNG